MHNWFCQSVLAECHFGILLTWTSDFLYSKKRWLSVSRCWLSVSRCWLSISTCFTGGGHRLQQRKSFWQQDIYCYNCEQVLFVYVFTIIPPRLTDPCNFNTVLLVTREPEQTTLLFWSAATWPSHSRPAIAAEVRAIFKSVFSIFWPLVCLPTLRSPSPFYALSQV